jgi:hypothetical protein
MNYSAFAARALNWLHTFFLVRVLKMAGNDNYIQFINKMQVINCHNWVNKLLKKICDPYINNISRLFNFSVFFNFLLVYI